MSKTSLHISILEPCHEDWSKMTPTQCGAFCNACQKEVVDFSQMSEAEIVQRLSKTSGKVCGRIAADKLDRELVKYESDAAWYSWKKWAVAAGVLLGVTNAEAYSGNINSTSTDTIRIKKTSEAINTILTGQEIIVSGRVSIDGREMLPLAVIIFDSTEKTMSNTNGAYTIKLPSERFLNKVVSVEIETFDHVTQMGSFLIDSINMQHDIVIIVDVADKRTIVEPRTIITQGNMQPVALEKGWRIKHFFRRIGYAFKKHKD